MCAIGVALAFAEQYGMLTAVLAYFCCNIIIYFWGWIFWKSESKWMVMIVWTVAGLVAGGIQVAYFEPIEP